MNRKTKIALALVLGLTSAAQIAYAMTVNSTYINKTATEIRGIFGRYSNPTVYIDRRACNEPQLSAFACGPLHD